MISKIQKEALPQLAWEFKKKAAKERTHKTFHLQWKDILQSLGE